MVGIISAASDCSGIPGFPCTVMHSSIAAHTVCVHYVDYACNDRNIDDSSNSNFWNNCLIRVYILVMSHVIADL